MTTRFNVSLERDKRINQGFTFNGVHFQTDPVSMQRINQAAGSARDAIIFNGAQPNNLRWHGQDADFYWIATDNSQVTMDAHTVVAFASAANVHMGLHISAAANLKNMDPIPDDFWSDAYWPDA